jgi:hypothetical protein
MWDGDKGERSRDQVAERTADGQRSWAEDQGLGIGGQGPGRSQRSGRSVTGRALLPRGLTPRFTLLL